MPDFSNEEANNRQQAYRERTREYEIAADKLRRLHSQQRVYWLFFIGSALLFAFLGYTIVVPLWHEAAVMRWLAIFIVLVLWIVSLWLIGKNRPKIIEQANMARAALFDRHTAAAELPLITEASLRIYRESVHEDIEAYRRRAASNRRVNNLFQAFIIIGSVAVSSLSALNVDTSPTSIIAMVFSAIVSASAGLTAYFKFRERSFNLQSTADELEKHSTAVQYEFDDYEGIENEQVRLKRFVKFAERLKEEQRKRELQLEQSPESREERS